MRKSLALAVAFMLSGLIAASVNAGPNDPAAPQTGEVQLLKNSKDGGNAQVAEKKTGYSVAKDYKKRVAAKKRAAEMRKKLIQEGK